MYCTHDGKTIQRKSDGVTVGKINARGEAVLDVGEVEVIARRRIFSPLATLEQAVEALEAFQCEDAPYYREALDEAKSRNAELVIALRGMMNCTAPNAERTVEKHGIDALQSDVRRAFIALEKEIQP